MANMFQVQQYCLWESLTVTESVTAMRALLSKLLYMPARVKILLKSLLNFAPEQK